MPRESKITPGSNLMWESSRLMLPEHVERLLRQTKEWDKKEKPQLDSQYVEELNRKMMAAFLGKKKVGLRIFGKWQDRYLTGQITHIDPDGRRVKLKTEEGFFWVKLDDVLDVDGEEWGP